MLGHEGPEKGSNLRPQLQLSCHRRVERGEHFTASLLYPITPRLMASVLSHLEAGLRLFRTLGNELPIAIPLGQNPPTIVTKPEGGGGFYDARTGMPPGIPGGAMCVQRFDDSLNSAIHITYRISLRSSSLPEPRDPLLKVLFNLTCSQTSIF